MKLYWLIKFWLFFFIPLSFARISSVPFVDLHEMRAVIYKIYCNLPIWKHVCFIIILFIYMSIWSGYHIWNPKLKNNQSCIFKEGGPEKCFNRRTTWTLNLLCQEINPVNDPTNYNEPIIRHMKIKYWMTRDNSSLKLSILASTLSFN